MKIIRLSKNEDKTGMWIVLVCGIFFTPLIGWLVGLAFKEENKIEEDRKKQFLCSVCYVKYKEEYLGGELGREEKICRFCLEKRQKGEKIEVAKDYPRDIPETVGQKNNYYQSEPRKTQKESGERKILLRQLNRVQSKRSRYLTQFIINLVVLQWLLPLITIILFWMDLKTQMKTELLKNSLDPSLYPEMPLKMIIKDIFNFKLLTLDTYNYLNFKLVLGTSYKISLILVFLLPLGFWIYNLVKFLGANGEVNQLQNEIKEIERE